MWPNIHIIYVHIYIYVYITHLNCKIILGGFFLPLLFFEGWGRVMSWWFANPLKLRQSLVMFRIYQDTVSTAKRVVKQDLLPFFTQTGFNQKKCSENTLQKNRENWENTHHALHFGTFPFRCHASRPALQLSCSSVSLSSSSPSNLFLQFVTGKTGGSPIFPNHSDLCHVIPPSHDILWCH